MSAVTSFAANLNFTFATGASANKMLVFVMVDDSPTVSGISYNSVAFSGANGGKITSTTNTAPDNMEAWYLDNPSSGSHTLAVNMSASTNHFWVWVETLIGAASGAVDNSAVHTSGGQVAPQTFSLTPVAASVWIAGTWMGNTSGLGETQSGGCTLRDLSAQSVDATGLDSNGMVSGAHTYGVTNIPGGFCSNLLIGVSVAAGSTGPTTDQLMAAMNQPASEPQFEKTGIFSYRSKMKRRNRIFVPEWCCA